MSSKKAQILDYWHQSMPKKTRHWVRLIWKKCPVSIAQFELMSSFFKNLSFNSFAQKLNIQIDVAYLNSAWISKLFSAQYHESDLNRNWKARPKRPTASKVTPLWSRITIVWNPTNSGISTVYRGTKALWSTLLVKSCCFKFLP